MSNESDQRKNVAEKVKELSTEKRRKLQHNLLVNWNAGFITARECIERIVDFETMIYIDTNYLKDKANKQEAFNHRLDGTPWHKPDFSPDEGK